MSRTINALAILGLALAVPAFAQAPAATAPPAPPVNTNAATPVAVPPAEAGLSRKALELNGMESELALALKALQLDSANAQRKELNAKISGVREGTNQVPELIGISSARGVYRAQFLAGAAVVDVGSGDWITGDWRIVRIADSGVELARRGSDQRHQVLFGQQPVSSKEIAADIAAASRAATPYGMDAPAEVPFRSTPMN